MGDDLEAQRSAAGQRRVNILWEVTQSLIALAIVSTFIYVCGKMALTNDTAFVVLSDIVSLVIGFYFGRTNHTRTGGVSTEHR